jgi:hypothetical protein
VPTLDEQKIEFRRRFDENKVKRDKGRFAKKAVKSLFVPAPLRTKNKPSTNVYRKHNDGDVTHVSDDGSQRMVYDARTKRFDQQVKQDDGTWQSIGKRDKPTAYLLTKRGWRVGEQSDQPTPAERAAANVNRGVPQGSGAPPEPTLAAPTPPHPNEADAPLSVSTDFPTRTAHDMGAQQDEMEQGNPRTQDQLDAIYDYSLNSYHDMNDCLRASMHCSPTVDSNNQQLSDAMRPTTQPFTAFRSTDLQHVGGAQSLDDLRALVGGEISDAGFTSTSLDPNVTNIFGDVDLQIQVPVGSSATFPGAHASMPGEQEVILNAGTRYRVLEVDTTTNPARPAVRLEVIT